MGSLGRETPHPRAKITSAIQKILLVTVAGPVVDVSVAVV